jgi:hypothetical protein
MALSVANLNVYPFQQATVVDNEGTANLANYALTAHTDAAYIAAYPTVGSGGTVGVYTPAAGTIWVAGFLDGSQIARLFYTDGSTIALPTVKYIAQTIYSDLGELGTNPAGGAIKGGGFKIALTPAANNLIDATSPMTFYLDGFAMLIMASTAYG